MSKLTVLTPPDEPAVSVAAVKNYLRIGHDGEDDLILDLTRAATTRLEQAAGLALVRQTLQLSWIRWPSAISGRGARLPIAPIMGLNTVLVIDESDRETDVTDRFQVVCGRLCLRPWSMLPRVSPTARIIIRFDAGFGAASNIPDDLLDAILRLVAATYGARQTGANALDLKGGLPVEVQSILDARREVRI